MDIGFYISELLEKNGEVNVPGLGYLAQAYVPGYYNETEGKFYPPQHNVQFDAQQLADDDVLTQYIADIKNISLASSKYFTEKYIAEVKEDVLVKDVPIGNLGHLYTEYGKLLFKPADGTTNDPAFFGYPPVNITRVGQEAAFFNAHKSQPEPTPEPEPPVPNTPEPFYTSESNAPVFQSKPSIEEELYEETESKRSYTWIILLFVLIFAALAVVGAHQYYPAQFNNAKNWIETTVGLKKADKPVEVKKKEVVAVIPPKIDSLAADSIKKQKTADSIAAAVQIKKEAIKTKKQRTADSLAAVAQAKIQAKADAKIKKQKTADSLAAVAQAKKDAIKAKAAAAKQSKATVIASKSTKQASTQVPLGQVVSQSVAGNLANSGFDPGKPWVVLISPCTTQAAADAAIANLKKKGIDAFIVPNARNSKIYVAVAGYKTIGEAEAAVPAFKKKGVTDAYFTQITQKK